jgi:hypothetical protein
MFGVAACWSLGARHGGLAYSHHWQACMHMFCLAARMQSATVMITFTLSCLYACDVLGS